MLYQYDIHIIISPEMLRTTTIYNLFSPEVEPAQLALKWTLRTLFT